MNVSKARVSCWEEALASLLGYCFPWSSVLLKVVRLRVTLPVSHQIFKTQFLLYFAFLYLTFTFTFWKNFYKLPVHFLWRLILLQYLVLYLQPFCDVSFTFYRWGNRKMKQLNSSSEYWELGGMSDSTSLSTNLFSYSLFVFVREHILFLYWKMT